MGASCGKQARKSKTPYDYDEKPKKNKKNSKNKDEHDGMELTPDEEDDLADFLEDIVEAAELRLSIALQTPEGQAIIDAEVQVSDKTVEEIKEHMHAVVRKRLVRKAKRQWLEALAEKKKAKEWIEDNPNQKLKVRKKYSKRRLKKLANQALDDDAESSFSSAGESDFDEDYEFKNNM